MNEEALYRNKQWLVEQYYDNELSTKEIGKKCGVNPITIARWLSRFGLVNRQVANRERLDTILAENGDWIRTAYCDNRRATRYIGNVLGCSHGAVLRMLDTLGVERIPRRGKPPGEAAKRSLYAQYRTDAKRRNMIFELGDEEFYDLTMRECYYCGAEPSAIIGAYNHNGVYVYNGIDRVDNDLGYVSDNVVPCCKQCNMAKGNMSRDEFLSLVERIYVHSCVGRS